MSEDMVKRVAIAIGDLIIPAVSGGSSVTIGTVARAAIEAMRIPTEEMITAAVEATSEQVDWVNGLFGGSYDNATQVFSDSHTAAIDAALKEQTK